MTKTEDKTKEQLGEGTPLFTDVFEAIAKGIHIGTPLERIEFARRLAMAAITVAKWSGYMTGVRDGKRLDKDVVTRTEQQSKQG